MILCTHTSKEQCNAHKVLCKMQSLIHKMKEKFAFFAFLWIYLRLVWKSQLNFPDITLLCSYALSL